MYLQDTGTDLSITYILASAETGSSVLFMALCSRATPSIICGFYSFPKWTSSVHCMFILCSYLTMLVALNYEFSHRFKARKNHWNNITELPSIQQASPS